MTTLTKKMRKYLTSGETRQGYTKEVQATYNSRLKTYARNGIDDLTLLAENIPPSWRKEIFDKRLHKLVEAALTPKHQNYNEYIHDLWAYETALDLLQVLHGVLNKILNHKKIRDMKLLDSDIMKRRFTNIAALEMMLIAYSEKMGKQG